MIRVSLLSIGDELCIGQVVNTNAAWIADQCSSIGCFVHTHRVVGDVASEMIQALSDLVQTSDYVLITGGLGPTHDDITKQVLCDFFNDSMVEDEVTLALLVELFAQRNRELSARNRAQALIPSTAKALPNGLGSAPGLLMMSGETTLVAMPGVPNEMKAIMRDHVLPRLKSTIVDESHSVMLYKTFLTSGIAESSLADLLGEPTSFLHGQQLAFLPSYQGVRLRLSIEAITWQQGQSILGTISDYLYAKVGTYIVGESNESLSSITHRVLLEKGCTLSLAESCTGGMLGMQLTEHSGSSQYFLGGIECYSNESKIRDVGVKAETIETFGAVSHEVTEELAQKVRQKFQSDYAIAISGVAGPTGGSIEKPVGTVWIALADKDGVSSSKNSFGNDRAANRERSCAAALLMLLERIR